VLLTTAGRVSGRIAIALLASFCAGCSTVPSSGPQGVDVRNQSEGGAPVSVPYALVEIKPDIIRTLGQYVPRLSTAFADRSPPKAYRFGVGDIVSVSIFEAAAGGLFTSDSGIRAGNFVTLPNQAVDEQGNIAVPYAGSVPAKNRTPSQLQADIVSRLKARALEPQVVVAVAQQNTSLISVLGDVRAAGRFPASPSGERVLDAITRAGGPGNQGYDMWVTLERSGHRATIPFGALLYEPANNIYVIPNDVIYLYNQPQTFVAFGAAGAQGQFNFGAWRLSLAEAVGKQGGLNDVQADPSSVFLYRGETREVAAQLGVDCSKYEGPIIPVIYHVNFRDPSGYFLAQSFEMRNKDVLFSSNSPMVETTKFLTFLRTVMATANDPIIYATNGYILRNTMQGAGSTTIITTPTPIAAGH
jgi:polysaccharide export outer membrane protein